MPLLSHKGDPWNWQNKQVLKRDLSLDALFYLLHRDGAPFANIMTIEVAGVGIFGHVWTQPADRQQRASSSLMALQMADFHQRGGQALFLGTGYESVAFKMYERFGFRSVEPQSGYMSYYAGLQEAFENRYFAQSRAHVVPLDWCHWPSAVALFLGDWSGLIRCAPLQLIGRQSSEAAFLPLLIAAEERNHSPQAMVLQQPRTNAVVGFTTWTWHPIWPETCLFDIYCHPQYWDQAGMLLDALQLPDADRHVAYGDPSCPDKHQLLIHAGFGQVTRLPERLSVDVAKTNWIDTIVFERSGLGS